MLQVKRIEEQRSLHLVKDMEVGDPIRRFADSLRRSARSLDFRTDDQLAHDGIHHQDPAHREYAFYLLVERNGAKALSVISEALEWERDVATRVNLLWALQSINDPRAAEICLKMRDDGNHRVSEWARVFSWEKGWTDEDFRRARRARYYSGRTFDETLFLHIKSYLYVRLTEDNSQWGVVVLSPQMLARVYGQALACPVTDTRERELVLSKSLKGLHADGSDHYESFLFRGFTERADPESGNFYFEASTPRPFYRSGLADDASEGVIDDVTIPFAREGQWFTNSKLEVEGGVFPKAPIEYVRGVFQGWAYVNIPRIMEKGGEFLFPGNSVLSTLHHPEAGMFTNGFLVGSFKGKVLDWNDDGVLDLNLLPAYATRKGEVDSNLDGIPDVPGRTVCPHGGHQHGPAA